MAGRPGAIDRRSRRAGGEAVGAIGVDMGPTAPAGGTTGEYADTREREAR